MSSDSSIIWSKVCVQWFYNYMKWGLCPVILQLYEVRVVSSYSSIIWSEGCVQLFSNYMKWGLCPVILQLYEVRAVSSSPFNCANYGRALENRSLSFLLFRLWFMLREVMFWRNVSLDISQSTNSTVVVSDSTNFVPPEIWWFRSSGFFQNEEIFA